MRKQQQKQSDLRATRRCPRCAGTGRVDLPPELVATLALVPYDGVTSAALAQACRLNVGGMNGRLTQLMEAGLVTRAMGVGRQYVYRRVETAT